MCVCMCVCVCACACVCVRVCVNVLVSGACGGVTKNKELTTETVVVTVAGDSSPRGVGPAAGALRAGMDAVAGAATAAVASATTIEVEATTRLAEVVRAGKWGGGKKASGHRRFSNFAYMVFGEVSEALSTDEPARLRR